MERRPDLTIRVPAQPGRDSPRPTAVNAQFRVRRVFAPDEQPEVLVRVDGEWHRGVLRKWSQDPTGAWWGSVAWGRSAGTRFLDTLPSDRIRSDADGWQPPSPSSS